MGRHKVLGAFLSYIGFVVVWQLINMVLNISGLGAFDEKEMHALAEAVRPWVPTVQVRGV